MPYRISLENNLLLTINLWVARNFQQRRQTPCSNNSLTWREHLSLGAWGVVEEASGPDWFQWIHGHRRYISAHPECRMELNYQAQPLQILKLRCRSDPLLFYSFNRTFEAGFWSTPWDWKPVASLWVSLTVTTNQNGPISEIESLHAHKNTWLKATINRHRKVVHKESHC